MSRFLAAFIDLRWFEIQYELLHSSWQTWHWRKHTVFDDVKLPVSVVIGLKRDKHRGFRLNRKVWQPQKIIMFSSLLVPWIAIWLLHCWNPAGVWDGALAGAVTLSCVLDQLKLSETSFFICMAMLELHLDALWQYRKQRYKLQVLWAKPQICWQVGDSLWFWWLTFARLSRHVNLTISQCERWHWRFW